MTKATTQMAKAERIYDLEDWTAAFGGAVILFAKRIPPSPVKVPLIVQLIRAGTSIGANPGEADDAKSKKYFRHKIGLCRKESKEAKHWLRWLQLPKHHLKMKPEFCTKKKRRN